MKAQWIWHENEFEYSLYQKIMHRRRERNVRANPAWKLPMVHSDARFVRFVTLEKETVLHFYAEGEMSLRVDNEPSFRYDFNGTLVLPAGEHSILVEVYNPNGVPSIFVEGEGCESGTEWESCLCDKNWCKVGCAGLYDVKRGPSSYGLPVREKEPIAVEFVKSNDGREGRLFVFDQEIFAFSCFRGITGKGKIEVYYGESREEALDVQHSETADCFVVEETCREISANLSKGFQYVFVPDSKDIGFTKFIPLEEYYPIENRAKFRSNDELLNRIYDVSLYTLALTSREFFIDGLKRDRWVWAGDTLQSELMSLYSYYDLDLIKRTLIALAGKEKITQHINGIMDYTFYVILAAGEYYRYTGDLEFIKRIFPRLVELQEFCLQRRDENGFMKGLPGDWVFIDWADFPTDGEVCAEQILLYESLRRMVEMSEAIGYQIDPEWKKTLRTLWGKIQETYWTENGYAHDETRTLMTRYGGMFAVLFGLANEEERKVVLSRTLLNEDVLQIKTPYMKFYETAAIAELGETERMLEYIKSYWGGMLKEGATTFWEEYDPNVKGAEKYAMYGRKYGKSLCHSWGASPVYLIGKYLVGLTPAETGYQRFRLQPCLDGKTFFDAELPANDGNVRVCYDGNTLKVFSEKANGTLRCFGKEYEIEKGEEFVLSLQKTSKGGNT